MKKLRGGDMDLNRKNVIRLLGDNPDPSKDQIEKWANKYGWNVEDLEAAVYGITGETNEERFRDYIKKGHFKNYDKYYYYSDDDKTATSDSEGDASSRKSNIKMINDVIKHLWKNAKVKKDSYVINAKNWDALIKDLRKEVEKYGAGREGKRSEGEGDQ